jgi:threonine synthase
MNSNMGEVLVLCVNSDFDFCQKTVKKILNDSDLIKELRSKFEVNLSSGNSINWGRLFPQVMYSVNSYLELVKVLLLKYIY